MLQTLFKLLFVNMQISKNDGNASSFSAPAWISTSSSASSRVYTRNPPLTHFTCSSRNTTYWSLSLLLENATVDEFIM